MTKRPDRPGEGRRMAAGRRDRSQHRLDRAAMASLQTVGDLPDHPDIQRMDDNVIVDCGWGRLLFGQTFADPLELARELCKEQEGRRDIALYLRDPHVVLAQAPQHLFLDPSHTFRLWLDRYRPARTRPRGFVVRRLQDHSDVRGANVIYQRLGMVPMDPDRMVALRGSALITALVAIDTRSGVIGGVVMGVDHAAAFEDPDNGSSLWALAVDPQAPSPGIGQVLVRTLAEHYQARGRAFMDLSVMHDNDRAIRLYTRLGFQRVPAFCIKTKNALNEKLFIGPDPAKGYNPYARLIIDEARRRGIAVDPVDPEGGFFTLSFGGRAITCRESLSELTSAVAMSRCDDKAVTRRLLERAGFSVPAQRTAGDTDADRAFLLEHGRIVVKPARGEQGVGISVDIGDPREMAAAIERAREVNDVVLLEQYCPGHDVRIIVIGFKVVAAAVRRPPTVTGDGHSPIRDLIGAQSRRRAAATAGESHIPLDSETERCVRLAGHGLDDVLAAGQTIAVRKTANLHTGGTIHDVTDRLHAKVVDAAQRAARAIDIPVVGFDFLMPELTGPDYVIIEANERPGLANHEPQPTAQRFVDLLFPMTAPGPRP